MLHIVGIITTTTHVHQSDPGKDGNRSPTIKTWAWDRDHVRRLIPFVTANSVRGQIRRQAAGITLDALGAPVSRALFSVLTTGRASRKDIGMQASTDAMVAGAGNVFAGLFGGGGYMLSSRFGIGPLVPVVEWCQSWIHPSIQARMIPIERLSYRIGQGADEGKLVDVPLTTDLILTSRDDILAGHGAKYIQDYQRNVDAWIAEVTGGRAGKAAAKAEQDAAKKRGEKAVKADGAISVDVSGFNLIEAILPGTPLQFWLRFNARTTEAQVGLMLLAVRDWANANVIGGASARGFGRFTANLALYDDEKQIGRAHV